MKITLTELRESVVPSERLLELIDNEDEDDDEKCSIASELLTFRQRQDDDRAMAMAAYMFEVICIARELGFDRETFLAKSGELFDAHVEEFPYGKHLHTH